MYLVEVSVNADARTWFDSLLERIADTVTQCVYVQVSCVLSGQKSCLIEHGRLIIMQNVSDSTSPRISLHYEYGVRIKA